MADDLHSLAAPYALDALDDEEHADFEQHLATCEHCREEVAGLREAAANLAYGAEGPEPPPELRQRILAQARDERRNVTSLSARRRLFAPLAAAAAVAAAVALGVGLWAATRPAADPFASVLTRPGAKIVPLGDRGAVAVAPDGEAALALGVDPAPRGKTYEAWVIHEGKARPAGIFAGRDGTTVVRIARDVPAGAVVAVTLERAGGVDQPTQQPLVQTRPLS
jgi:anti-sigma-K factor RskA